MKSLTLRLGGFVVLAALVGSLWPLSGLAAAEGTFTDIAGNTHKADIEKIAAVGITRSCNPPANTWYCPDDFVTRAQMASLLARALGLSSGSTGSFADIAGNTHEADIGKIAAVGITRGCNSPANTLYCPDDFVTRAQMASFLARAPGLITPRPTTSGGFDVVISPTDDVNAVLQSNPEGTSFLLRAGTYRRLTLIPRSGQTITGENGTVLDGEGATPHAMGGETVANAVTLRNLKIINYTSYAIDWGAQGWGERWVIDNCEIAHNYGGVSLKREATVRNSFIHHNTVHGVLTHGKTVIEGNEVAFNHSKQHLNRAQGGILHGNGDNSVIRNNHIHNNYASGLHLDGYKNNILVENNLVEDNDDAGIVYELGHSATIRNNVVRRNGANSSGSGGHGAGILVFNATDVTVEGNRVENNRHGIVGRQGNRINSRTGELWELKNLRVVNNTVKMNQGYTGIYDRLSDWPSLSANNVFERNSYTLASPEGLHFRWGDMKTFSEWQKIHPRNG